MKILTRLRLAALGSLLALSVLAPAQNRVLVDGQPPLTESLMGQSVAAHENLLNLKMTAAERQRLQKVYVDYWQQGDSAFIQGALGIVQGHQRSQSVAPAKWALARRANILNLITTLSADTSGEAYGVAVLSIYRRAHPGVLPSTPDFSAEIADAFIEAYLFAGQLRSGKAAPALSAEAQKATRLALARDFAKLPAANRQELTRRMIEITRFRVTWSEMSAPERLAVRAEMGAKLSPEEMQVAMQYRQMMNQHVLQMTVSSLNAIQNNQQIIMGSAPRWNPTTQRWERIGGINTEYR